MAKPIAKPFLTDVKTLRQRNRQRMELGAVTETYGGDVKRTIEILQSVLATELVCVMRYTQHAIAATGLASESVAEEFAEHAKEEQEHAMSVAERINQLGADPDFNPATFTARSATEYQTGENLVAMIKENLVAERIVIDHYRELIRFFADHDPSTRTMVERILAVEEDHASDMVDLLAIHAPETKTERKASRPAARVRPTATAATARPTPAGATAAAAGPKPAAATTAPARPKPAATTTAAAQSKAKRLDKRIH